MPEEGVEPRQIVPHAHGVSASMGVPSCMRQAARVRAAQPERVGFGGEVADAP